MARNVNIGCDTYRAYDANGVLLYVGMSMNAVLRMTKHVYESEWYADVSRIEIDRHETYELAARHERHLVITLKPLWNVHFSESPIVQNNFEKRRNAVEKYHEVQSWVAIDNHQYEKLGREAGGWMAVLGVIVNNMDRFAVLHITNADIGRKLDISRQAVHQSMRKLYELGVIEKCKDKHGKVKVKLNPRFGWNYGIDQRNAEIARRDKAELERVMRKNKMTVVKETAA